jgi:hypothetical protein
MTHQSPTHAHPQSRPTNPIPTNPGAGKHPQLARQPSSSNHTFSHSWHSGNGWHHGHHYGWGSWSDGVAIPWDYNPGWYEAPGVVVVPEEKEIVEPQYVTVTKPPVVATTCSTAASQNSDEADPAQLTKTP